MAQSGVSSLESAVISPVHEYVYPAMIIIGLFFLLWVSFTKSGKEFIETFFEGIGAASTVAFFVVGMWFLFLLFVASFLGLVGSFFS